MAERQGSRKYSSITGGKKYPTVVGGKLGGRSDVARAARELRSQGGRGTIKVGDGTRRAILTSGGNVLKLL